MALLGSTAHATLLFGACNYYDETLTVELMKGGQSYGKRQIRSSRCTFYEGTPSPTKTEDYRVRFYDQSNQLISDTNFDLRPYEMHDMVCAEGTCF